MSVRVWGERVTRLRAALEEIAAGPANDDNDACDMVHCAERALALDGKAVDLTAIFKYRVDVREVHIQGIEVEAESEEAAIRAVQAGEGTFIDDALEYSHALDSETWTVDKV